MKVANDLYETPTGTFRYLDVNEEQAALPPGELVGLVIDGLRRSPPDHHEGLVIVRLPRIHIDVITQILRSLEDRGNTATHAACNSKELDERSVPLRMWDEIWVRGRDVGAYMRDGDLTGVVSDTCLFCHIALKTGETAACSTCEARRATKARGQGNADPASHHTIGHHFRGYDGKVYLIDYHGPSGYWIAELTSRTNRRSISERAIGRTFHHHLKTCPCMAEGRNA